MMIEGMDKNKSGKIDFN